MEQIQTNINPVQNNVILDQLARQNKTLVIIFSVLLLISLTIAGFFAYQTQMLVKELVELKATTPTPTTTSMLQKNQPASDLSEEDPTTNWKTYVDKELNYQIKYPANFDFVEKKSNSDYITIRKPGGEVEGTDSFSHFRLTVEETSEQNLEMAIEKSKNNSKNIFGDDLSFSKTTTSNFGNVSGQFYFHSGYGYQQHIFVANKNTNKVVHVTVIFSNKDIQEQEQAEVNQILSTFKFTN